MTWRVACALFCATFLCSYTQADPLYRIVDITPDGYISATAYDINSDGDAVGVASDGSSEAFFYYDHSAGTSTAFGVGVVSPRRSIIGTGFREAAINDSGSVAGTAVFIGGATERRGFIYNGSSFTNLGVLAGATATGIRPASDALDLNSAGIATGTATSGAGTIPTETDNIDVYTGTSSPISDIDGDITVATRGDFGRAINNAGLVVGQNQDGKATLFSGASETVLLALTSQAGDNSVAYDLNEVGEVLIENSTDSDAYVYDTSDASLTMIPQIGTGNRMFPKAINEDGDAVGWGDRSGGTSGQNFGFVFLDGTSFVLDEHIADKTFPAGTEPGDWEKVRTAWGINDDGWIVGVGDRRFSGGTFPTPRAYLLIPVPEPAGAMIAGWLGLLGLGRRRFKHRL